MIKNNIPFKVAVSYGVVAIVLAVAITLIYHNTQSLLSINQASKEYVQKRESSDSLITALLKEEQLNLRQLTEAMSQNKQDNYLHQKVRNLNTGKDSVVVHPKTEKTHEQKNTTVEVMKTRKGFFRRLADAFKKEHAETLSIKKDSDRTIVDTTATPINVADKVAHVLSQIDQEERHANQTKQQAVSKEMGELQLINAQLALKSSQQLNDIHQKEKHSMQQAIDKAMQARKDLLRQIGLLAIVTLCIAFILLWHIWRDTRKERIYREKLECANEEIQRIMSQRERLLLTITHDIKAPAASITGFLDLTKEYLSQGNFDKVSESLDSIHHSATHLAQLVASLLDYHQLENGLLKLHPTHFNPSALITQSIEGMQLQAKNKGINLTQHIDSSLNAQAFYADDFRIRQVINNLVSNAIKYTPKGSVSISASLENNLFIIKVKDTGQGMTPEESQKIFQAFTRLQGAQGIEGTGLGLSITQELVSLLGGNIHLESEKGKGSTFTVSIPVTLATPTTLPEKTQPQKLHFANHKILVLDDDTLQLQLLREILRNITKGTWEVITCNHITEALTILHNERPSILMMDIEMPEMSGMELIKHIHHNEMLTIAMTAHDASIIPQLKEAGFDDCLFKPFKKEKLAQLLGLEYAENQEEKKEPTDTHRFQPLLAFAENDPEAEKEIIQATKTELQAHYDNLQTILQSEWSTEGIGKIAHKLLPVATMLDFKSIEQIKALTPEHIQQLEETQIRGFAHDILTELREII